MSDLKLRQAIALEAARLMYERVESEYFTAKRKAARRLCRGGCKPKDLPSNAEIRDQIQRFARLHEADRRTEHLHDMRLDALRLMRVLRAFKPRLIGSVMTGHVRKGSDIDLHLFSDSVALVAETLEREWLRFDVERKQILKHQETRVFNHIHVESRFPFELTGYEENKAHYAFRSSITGKAIERASIAELEEFLRREYPDLDLEETLAKPGGRPNPWPVFRRLLIPLEEVNQNPRWHPEGDALYHSLQVFEQARERRPYDEEFLLAALLHDVGKAIDSQDHVAAALEAMDGLLTERTQFLIAHHMDAIAIKDGTLPFRERLELQQSPDFDDPMLLRECDDAGRVPGLSVVSLDEAIAFVQELEAENGDW